MAPYFCPDRLIWRFGKRHGLDAKAAMAALLSHDIWPERFRRNYGLVSAQTQRSLLDLPIFIAGCGGLGGEVSAMLTRLGAGRLVLCDFDCFEESNLNRQRFCTEQTLGHKKALVAAASLRALASFGDYTPLMCRLTPDNVDEQVANSKIVIDCLDSVAGKIMLEQAAARTGGIFLHGSVLAQEGFAFISDPAQGVLAKLYGQDPQTSGAGSVLVPVVTGTASLMLSLFVNWLNGRAMSAKLLHGDFSVPEVEAFQLP